MRGVFDDRQYQQAQAGQDTELTLTPPILVMLGLGLLAICGVCFAIGYSAGHSSAHEVSPMLPLATDGSIPAPVDSSGRPKPSANAQTAAATPPDAPPQDETPPPPTQASETVQGSAVAAASGSSGDDAQPSVKPAMGNGTSPAASGVPAQGAVAPAMPAAGNFMVQIAAVSEQDDAEVLMGALRKRGYAVAAHREPLDGLIHVRIGPFKTRNEAETWREKLFNDGYNAVVQP